MTVRNTNRHKRQSDGKSTGDLPLIGEMRLINHAEGELLHTKYPPTVGGAAGNVSVGQNPVERKQPLYLYHSLSLCLFLSFSHSLTPSYTHATVFSPHVALSRLRSDLL